MAHGIVFQGFEVVEYEQLPAQEQLHDPVAHLAGLVQGIGVQCSELGEAAAQFSVAARVL